MHELVTPGLLGTAKRISGRSGQPGGFDENSSVQLNLIADQVQELVTRCRCRRKMSAFAVL